MTPGVPEVCGSVTQSRTNLCDKINFWQYNYPDSHWTTHTCLFFYIHVLMEICQDYFFSHVFHVWYKKKKNILLFKCFKELFRAVLLYNCQQNKKLIFRFFKVDNQLCSSSNDLDFLLYYFHIENFNQYHNYEIVKHLLNCYSRLMPRRFP